MVLSAPKSVARLAFFPWTTHKCGNDPMDLGDDIDLKCTPVVFMMYGICRQIVLSRGVVNVTLQ